MRPYSKDSHHRSAVLAVSDNYFVHHLLQPIHHRLVCTNAKRSIDFAEEEIENARVNISQVRLVVGIVLLDEFFFAEPNQQVLESAG